MGATFSGTAQLGATATTQPSAIRGAIGGNTLLVTATMTAVPLLKGRGGTALTVIASATASGYNTTANAGVNYPNGLDVFSVPTNPSQTPLSSAGSSSRDHVESHRDLGIAIQALERNAAQLSHDHGGGSGGFATQQLLQQNTHQSPDTDAAASSLHHTVGPAATPTNFNGKYQAAPSFHTHDYLDYPNQPSTILNRPYFLCTSVTRPAAPAIGTMIYESDTNRMRVWAAISRSTPIWQLLPVANVPKLRLLQTQGQTLNPGGTTISFQEVDEDTFGFFSPTSSPSIINVSESGLYHVNAAVQWSPQICPDVAHIRLYLNNAPTVIQHWQFLRGNTFTPGFSQTMTISGLIRLNGGDQLTLGADYKFSGGWLGQGIATVLSWFGLNQDADRTGSRFELAFLGV